MAWNEEKLSLGQVLGKPSPPRPASMKNNVACLRENKVEKNNKSKFAVRHPFRHCCVGKKGGQKPGSETKKNTTPILRYGATGQSRPLSSRNDSFSLKTMPLNPINLVNGASPLNPINGAKSRHHGYLSSTVVPKAHGLHLKKKKAPASGAIGHRPKGLFKT